MTRAEQRNPSKRQAMLEDLLRICRRYNAPDSIQVVIRESYIPYVPMEWNRILVLAESQNLNDDKYVQSLRALTQDKKMCRLYPNRRIDNGEDDRKHKLDVGPWDDGSLKLAVGAAFGVVAVKTAVSNAVPWSQREVSSGANVNPDDDLQSLSSALWREMLDILKPKLVICSGNVAESVIRQADWSNGRIKKLRLPSALALNSSGMFDENDLLIRYPEVKRILGTHPEWGEGRPVEKRNKIFFACHAVSLHKGNTTSSSS